MALSRFILIADNSRQCRLSTGTFPPDNMKPSDYIRKGWCQFNTALAEDGSYRPAKDGEACRWCLDGALYATVSGQNSDEEYTKLYNLVADELGKDPVDWNDTPGRTQAEVIAALEAVGL